MRQVYENLFCSDSRLAIARDDGDLGDESFGLGWWKCETYLHGKLILSAIGDTRKDVLTGSKLALMHELVLRADVQEHGTHQCDFCEKILDLPKANHVIG